MTKKTKARTKPPKVNLFTTVEHMTWRKLTVLAATVGMGRLDLYSFALEWAVNDPKFLHHLRKVVELTNLKVKK